ncbi:MAG TPA: hypothetical protein VG895_04560 [Patescibacteria group bacterium]|nr:hypothetical protein [Patescibacteria group bacterium]
MVDRQEKINSQFDFTETKKVFDTAIYKKYSLKKRSWVIAHDLAGLVIEAGDRNLEERINPWYIAITQEGKIINLTSREEVAVNFGNNNELSSAETAGAIDFYYQKAKQAKENEFIISFSPSGGNSPYKESRINIAKVRHLLGMKVLECYGIPSKLSPQDLLLLADKLLIKEGKDLIFNPDDLRQAAFLTSNLDFLDLDSKALEEIKKGAPRKIKSRAVWDALPIAKQMSIELEFAVHERDYIRSGAAAERLMQEKGWKINTYACPGSLNQELEFRFGNYVMDGMGNFRQANLGEKKAKYVKECPYCHKVIEKKIEPGYQCSCGQVFEGVC